VDNNDRVVGRGGGRRLEKSLEKGEILFESGARLSSSLFRENAVRVIQIRGYLRNKLRS
jgi:hypothetical protein